LFSICAMQMGWVWTKIKFLPWTKILKCTYGGFSLITMIKWTLIKNKKFETSICKFRGYKFIEFSYLFVISNPYELGAQLTNSKLTEILQHPLSSSIWWRRGVFRHELRLVRKGLFAVAVCEFGYTKEANFRRGVFASLLAWGLPDNTPLLCAQRVRF